MSNPRQQNEKRYGLYALGVVLILASIGLLIIWQSNTMTYQGIALFVLLFGSMMVRSSKVGGFKDFFTKNRAAGAFKSARKTLQSSGDFPGLKMLLVGVALLMSVGISYYLMYEDAVHGGRQGWPAYLFAGTGLVCVLFWSYLITKVLSFWR